jgi:hypothetical protein
VRPETLLPLRAVSALAALLATVAFLSWAVIAAVHADDAYNVHQVSGVWLTLARDAEHGMLYHPLHEGAVFGGTRYMPGQIALFAGAGQAAGDEILGAKLVVYAVAVLLFALIFVGLRLVDCPQTVALALAAVVLASGVGMLAATAVGGDALPVALQLSALVLVGSRPGRVAAAAAGTLCALALLAKFNALWAPLAILVWLLTRERTRAAVFGSTLGLTLVGGIAATEAVSNGRFSDNLLGLATSSFALRDVVLESPGKLVSLLAAHAVGVVVLVPFVLVGLALAVAERRLTLYHLSFVFALAIALVVLADPGAFYNHLIDVAVLSVLVVGDLWGRPQLRAVLLAAVVWAIGVGSYAAVKPEAAEAVRLALGRADTELYKQGPPADVIRSSDRILSDDPYVPLSVGQRPEITDAFALLQLLERHPEWRQELIGRLDAKAYDKVVLLKPLADTAWWRDVHLGAPVAVAIQRNYRLVRHLEWRDLWVYVPK